MEPIAAFSLAGTILQFFDAGVKFTNLAFNLYRDQLDENEGYVHLLKVTEDLQGLVLKLGSVDASDDTEASLARLANECNKTATRLRNILHKTRKGLNTRKRDALKSAFKLFCQEKDVWSLQGQLMSFRIELNLHLLLALRKHAATSTEQQEAVLRDLDIVRDQTLKLTGVAASILDYIVPKNLSPNERARELSSFRRELTELTYEDHEHAVDEHHELPVIHMPPEDRHRAQCTLLAGIRYDSMIDRQNRIVTAHESTFRWVFHEKLESSDSNSMNYSSFQEWLESDEQIYWITGKAGSGKSTLMKFLCSPINQITRTKPFQNADKDKTRQEQAGVASQTRTPRDIRESDIGQEMLDHIEQSGTTQDSENIMLNWEQSRCHPYLYKWADTSRLVFASFYFWNSGMELQMTTLGLLRTLLYQICAQRPDLLPTLMPGHWESACLFNSLLEDWTTSSMLDIFLRAIDILVEDSKVCIFIDGLDEFGDDHGGLISMIYSLIERSVDVKVCVASRPWDIFQGTFGLNANLRMEDLTFNDIKDFVQSKFTADPGFDNLRQRCPSFADQLMDNIVMKASGVFLWVDLVVASLLAGMQRGDRIEDFQRRLDELPPELESLYEKTLKSLDPFYLGHAAQYFTLVETATIPLTILQFSFADEESPMSAINLGAGAMPKNEICLRVDAMKLRLNNRCKGFLEVERGEFAQDSRLTVQYLHRTVRDFIRTPNAQKFLHSSTKTNFDPSTQLCVAYLMSIKCWQERRADLGALSESQIATRSPSILVARFLTQAARVLNTNEVSSLAMVEDFKRLISQPWFRDYLLEDFRQYKVNQSQLIRMQSSGLSFEVLGIQRFVSFPTDDSFLSLAVIYNIIPYVRAHAQWGGLICEEKEPPQRPLNDRFPLLFYALSCIIPEPRMVECLLDFGADPNFRISRVDSQTPWILALTKVTMLYTLQHGVEDPEEYSKAENKWKKTLKLMYACGGKHAKVPDPLLSPISRKILQDLKSEEPVQSSTRSWFGIL